MIDRSQFLKEIRNRDPHLGMLLDNLIDGIDGVANHLGVDPTGRSEPPPPLQAINVSVGDNMMHVTLTDNLPVKKNVNYFVEYATNPSFANAHVEHLGASRGRVIPLPALTSGSVQQTYYARAYSQYLGSNAQSKHAVFGGQYTPTPIQPTGTAKLDLLPSTGSGTAKSDGSQPGQGFGTDLTRPAIGPKRPAAPNPQ